MSSLFLLMPAVVLMIAAAIDLKTREIPDTISVALAICGSMAAVYGWAGILWWMVACGILTGLFVGLLMFRFAGFGGGDAKVIAGLGAILGPVGIWFFLFWMALAGGVLALIAKCRGQRDYAYGPAILLGYFGYLFFPADIWSAITKSMTY